MTSSQRIGGHAVKLALPGRSQIAFLLLCVGLFSVSYTVEPFRLPGNLTVSDYALILSAAMGLRMRLLDKFSATAMLGSGLYFISLVITSTQSYYGWSFLLEAVKLLFAMGIMTLTAISLIDNNRRFVVAVSAFALGAALNAMFSLIQMKTGQSFFFEAGNFWGRYAGFSEHPNEMGPLCAVIFGFFCYLTVNVRTSAWATSAALTSILAVGVITSASMTAAAGVIAAIVIAIFGQRRLFTALIGIFAFVSLSPVVLASITVAGQGGLNSLGSRLERLANRGSDYDTAASRMTSLDAAWRAISDNPFIGHPMIGELPHNFVVFAWLHGGIFAMIGCVLFVLSLITGVVNTYLRHYRSNIAVGALLAASVVFIISISVSPPAVRRSTWAFCWIGFAAVALHSKTRVAVYRPPSLKAAPQ